MKRFRKTLQGLFELEARLAPSGTPTLLKDVQPGGVGSLPGNTLVIGSKLFFTADDGTTGNELWVSDGTGPGTNLVLDINTENSTVPGNSSPAELTAVGSKVFFTALGSAASGRELWVSDGTAAGTKLVTEINTSGGSNPQGLVNVNGTLFFSANDGVNGRELWTTDGVVTKLVADILPGPGDGIPQGAAPGVAVGSTLFFTADDSNTGVELWRSNGTTASLVVDLSGGQLPSSPYSLTEFNGKVAFVANTPGTQEVYLSDGTAGGTIAITNINANAPAVGDLTNFNGRLVFRGFLSTSGYEPFISDGTLPTTKLLNDISFFGNDSSPLEFTVVGSTLYFSANEFSNTGRELWKTDGTTEGTVRVNDLNPGILSSNPSEITNVAGVVYFVANGGGGHELWRTDGTATTLVDVEAGTPALPSALAANGNQLYFQAFRSDVGSEIFRFDEDTIAPTIATITSPNPDGSYYTGNSIAITVTFSEPVTLTGDNLILTLDTGDTLTIPPFSGTTATVTFVVVSGHYSTDLTVTGVTLGPMASLTDLAGNAADLTLPTLNLGATSNIQINLPLLPPSITPISPQLVNAGDTVGPLLFSIFDPDTPSSALTVTVSSDNPTLLPTSAVTLSVVAGEGTLIAVTQPGLGGVAIITLTVTDPEGNSTSTPVLFLINSPPSISDIPDQTVIAGTVIGPLSFTIGDLESPPDSLVITVSSDNSSFISPSDVTISGTGVNRTITIVTPNFVGGATLTISVMDEGGLISTDTIAVDTILPPTISDIPDQTVLAGGVIGPIPFIISSQFTPAPGLELSVTSDNVAIDPTTIVFGGSGAIRTITIPTNAGIAANTILTVTVRDPETSLTATDTILVTQYTSPFISDIPDQSPPAGSTLGPIAFTIGGGLAAVDSLVLSVTSDNPSAISTNAVTFGGSGPNRTISVATLAGDTTTTTLTVTVTDPLSGLTATDTLTITPFLPPVISDIPNQTLLAGTAVGPLAFTVGGGQSPVNNLVLSVTSSDPVALPSSAVTFGGSGANRTMTITTTSGVPANTLLTVTVTDPLSGLTATDTLIVTQYIPPFVSDIPDQVVAPGNTVGPLSFTVGGGLAASDSLVLSVSSSDPASIPTSAVTFGGGGPNRTITIATLTGVTTPTTLTVTILDPGTNLIASDTITITPLVSPVLPFISDIPDQTVTAGTTVGPLAFTVGGGPSGAGSLVLSVSSSDPVAIPISAVTFGGSGANRTITVTTTSGLTANTTLTVTVTDPLSGFMSNDTLVITQLAPPTISDVPDHAVMAGNSTGVIAFTIGGGVSPLNNLVLTVTSGNPAVIPLGAVTFGGSGANRTITVATIAGINATTVLTVTVTDPMTNLTASDTLLIVQNNVPVPATFPFAVSRGPGDDSRVKVFNSDFSERLEFVPIEGYTNGLRSILADFNGDGIDDIATGTRNYDGKTGAALASRVAVFDGKTQAKLFEVVPFGDAFFNGLYLSAGDLNGDGLAELAVTPFYGGGSRIRVFSPNSIGQFTQIADFFGLRDAFDRPDFRFQGGGRTAIGDFDGDGFGDLAFAVGEGGGPRVAIYDGHKLGSNGGPKLCGDFFAMEPKLRNGVHIAAGDIDGDGRADLVVAPAEGGAPRVRIFSGVQSLAGNITPFADFFGGSTTSLAGLRIAVKNLDGDKKLDLVTGSGPGDGNLVNTYRGSELSIPGFDDPYASFDAFIAPPRGVWVG
ncbi:hypothetical protein BH11PLA2_BH11PLA2_17890 [soil metagenome]